MSRTELAVTLRRFMMTRPEDESPKISLKDYFSGSIPVMQYWDNPAKLPSDVKAAINGWQERFDGNHTLVDKQQARSFILEHIGSVAASAFDKSDHPAQEADFFRLAFLYVNGGVYVDADFLPGPDLEGCLVDGKASAIFWYRNNFPAHQHEILNGFMAARPRSPVVLEMLNDAILNCHSPRRGIWRDTGPGLVTARILDTNQIQDIGFVEQKDVINHCVIDRNDWSYKASGGSWQSADRKGHTHA